MTFERILMFALVTALLCILFSGCAALDRAVHPTQDGQGIETVVAGHTNAVPAAAIATGVAWLASELCGVAIPASAAVPVVLAIIGVWAWRRKRMKGK